MWPADCPCNLSAATRSASTFAGCVAFTRWRMTRSRRSLASPLDCFSLARARHRQRVALVAPTSRRGEPVVVTARDVPLRIGNGVDYPAKLDLPRGCEVRRLYERGGWLQVETGGGAVGWVPANRCCESAKRQQPYNTSTTNTHPSRGTDPVSTDRISEYLAQFAQTRTQMIEQLRRVIVGQTEVIEQILAAIFTRGHCLLVGVPGLAKTLMVSSISQILDVSFKRIQFTPDLMPSDITGTTVLDESETGPARVPLRQGADLRQHRAGRRDQPHAAQDAGRPAASHAGAAGHGRAGDVQPARAVLRHRHAEPDRAGRHLPAARSPARPLHVQHQGRLSRRSTRRSASCR